MALLKTSLALLVCALASSFGAPSKSAPVTGWSDWWFMGGDETHVISTATGSGIQNKVDGYDTVGSDAWKYSSKLPNCQTITEASYLKDSFNITGDHEVSFTFSIDCVTDAGTLNYKSQNNKYDIDIFVYNSANNKQLCSLRIWFDAGGYTNGNHSYELGVGENYPGAISGMNWINGDAQLKSEFQINFSKQYLFRSYVNKDKTKLVRLDNSKNDFLKNETPFLDGVENVFFMIKGDGGWQKTATIVLKSINGQSLASSEGNIIDDTAPDIIVTEEIPTAMEIGTAYTIPITAVDVLSTPLVRFYYDGILLLGNSFIADSTGKHTLKAEAIDDAGNISQKEFPINVTEIIVPPTITSVPTIEDQRLSFGSTFSCDMPEYTDNSGLATVSATIQNTDVPGSLIPLDFNSSTKEFTKTIDETYISGNYQVVYTVTNSAGSAVSEPVKFQLETYLLPKVDYVTHDDGITVKYVPDGILVHSIGRWRKTSFGIFDIRQGIDAYFTIPILSENGEKNTASYFDMQITNKENSNYWIMYRIWLDDEFLTNDSSPTNMYFNFGTPGNSQCIDVGDCGWLTRTVDGVDGRFHYNYNTNDGFQGEFRRVLQPAKGVANYTSRFFDEAGSNNFKLDFYVASRDGGVGDDQNSEFIMNELNDQNFENEDGVLTTYARPKVSVGTINKMYLANSSADVHVYVKDILNLNPIRYVRFSKQDKTVVKEESFTGETVTLNIPDTGMYVLKIFTKNNLGKEVGVTYDIEARSSLTPVEITISGSYPSTFEKGEKVSILAASYSPNVDASKSKITVKYGQNEEIRHVGDEISFVRAGMYTLTYYACDNAIPNVNETFERFYFNVLDREKPIVNVDVQSTFRAEEEVSVKVNVQDDTDCDVAVIVTDTNGYKTTYTSNLVEFIPETMGEYQVMVRVEDAYNNITIENKTLNIGKKAPNKTLISWIVIGCCVVGLLGAFVGLTVSTKVKANKEKVE